MDGLYVSNGGGNLIVLDYDAALAPSNSSWINVGTGGGVGADWVLGSGTSHNPLVTNSLTQISAAYEFDGSANGLLIIDVQNNQGAPPTFRGVFVRSDDHGSPDSVTYTPQFSSNLVDWFDSPAFPSIRADSAKNSAYEIVSITYPTLADDGQPARYFRVKVNVVE